MCVWGREGKGENECAVCCELVNLDKGCIFFLFFFLRCICLFLRWWVLVAACGLSLVVVRRAALCCRHPASRSCGFRCRAQAPGPRASVLWSWGSVTVVHRRRLTGTWGLPGPGIELVSLALRAVILSTDHQGHPAFFWNGVLSCSSLSASPQLGGSGFIRKPCKA